MHQGEELKKIRTERHLSAQDLAEKVGLKNRQNIYDLERRKSIDLHTLKAICKVLGISIKYFYPDFEENVIEADPIHSNEDNKIHIGLKIREARKKYGIKVDDFAAALGYANRQSVYSLEKRSSVDLLTLKKIAEVLEVSLDYFLNESFFAIDHNKPLSQPNLSEEDKLNNLTLISHEMNSRIKDQQIIDLQNEVIRLQKEVIELTKKLIN